MSREFREIRPEDMTKLQQIAEMMSRGSETYACRIADSIHDRVARTVADILVGKISQPLPDYERFVMDLTTSTKALVRKAELTAV